MDEKGGGTGLAGFFEDYLNKEPLFRNKAALQSTHTPGRLLHRDEQARHVAQVLAPALRGERPSNLFLYGKTGTGKTLTAKLVTEELQRAAQVRSVPLKVIAVNCKMKRVADTEYRLLAHISGELGKLVPSTGLPTKDVYQAFYAALDREPGVRILVLDEVDQLVGKVGNDILYNLTRMNNELQQARVAVVGISNDIHFTTELDPRVKSSLSEEEVIFHPYNAEQLQDILRQRAAEAFRENAFEAGVIEKCAAHAAREHGDARRALELLRVAGELAERAGTSQVMLCHIDEAEQKLDKDRIFDIVAALPEHAKAVLYAALSVCGNRQGNPVFTGEVYALYESLCKRIDLRALTQRRVSDIIAELDCEGIISAKVISKGRFGRTREITLRTNDAINPRLRKQLEDALSLEEGS
jgi:cell division control protein 6